MLATVAILVSVVCWMCWRWRHRRLLELAKAVPGPPSIPVLGNTLLFLTKPEDALETLTKMVHNYGEYMRFWIGPELNIVVENPDDIRLLLTSNKINQKGPLYGYIETLAGGGILTGGPSWRSHRRIATPAYNKKAVQHYAEVFNKEIDVYTEKLIKNDPDQIFDIYHDVVACTTLIVCQTLMGLSKTDAQNVNRLDEIVKETESLYNFIFVNMTQWWYQLPLAYMLTGRNTQQKYYEGLIHAVASSIIEQRRRALKTMAGDVMGAVDSLILSNELNELELIQETFTLFTTSQEASAKIASSVLLILAYLPYWQDLVYKEIVEVVGAEDSFISDEDVKKLRYLDMVFNEALRYFAIAAFIQRKVEEEVTINNGALILPVGANVTLPIHILHRDPRYWADPYRIDPGRFLPENVRARKSTAFVPFSLGPMDCIGRVYAKYLVKALVVKTLRRVQLLPGDLDLEQLSLSVAISVRVRPGYRVRCRPRDMRI